MRLTGAEWSTLNPLHTWPRRARAMLYGDNDMSAGRPKIASMVYEGLTHPVYLVQVM